MPRYAADSKERVRDAVDMADLAGTKTDLRRAGANRLEGLCPFHDERTPSFGIDPVKKLYHCFGCGEGGDVYDFVMKQEGLDFVGAMEMLAGRYGVELEVVEEDPAAAAKRARRERLFELLERVTKFYESSFWQSAEAAGAREYLEGRGMDEETLRGFRVGYAPSAWDTVTVKSRQAGFSDEELRAAGVATESRQRPGSIYDRFRRRVMFPLTDARGRVTGFGGRALGADQMPKYLNSAEGEVFHKRRQLFGLDTARPHASKAGAVIVAEGYMDVLALHQAGLRNAVAIMGTALTEEQVAELGRLASRVELALDADSSGKEAMLKAAKLAAGRDLELRVVPMDAGRDPADLVAQDGAEAMRKRVGDSVPFVRFHVERILEKGELGSAEGRDAALEELHVVFRETPPSAVREELLRLVAGRLGLSEALAESLVAEAPRASAGGGGAPAARGAGAVLDRRERTERTFLALCVALPEQGAKALRRVDLEQHFTSALVRRAAEQLREHLASPLDGVGEDDPELRALLTELTVRAQRRSVEPAMLEIELLQLDKERLEREIARAQAAGRVDVSSLAHERIKVKDEIDRAMDRAESGGEKPQLASNSVRHAN